MKKGKNSSTKQVDGKKALRQTTFNIPDCKRFSGYRPCFPNTRCYEECVDYEPIGEKILIVNLDAMGNVLVTTSLLPAIKRKYPTSHVSWITLKNAYPLLYNNPYLDEIYVWEPEGWMILQQMDFDVVMNVDKSRRSGAFTTGLRANEKLGFGINRYGAIIPLNEEARENYILGLDDYLKFRVNQKTVPQILCETFKLEYLRDRYVLELTPEEKSFCKDYKNRMGVREGDLVVGFNTGCSELYPNKKMTVDQHVVLINNLSQLEGVQVVLVGGPEDTQRNAEIARRVGDKIINTPTTEGLRRGLCYINLCDLIISGDSFGMHAAIGMKKYVIVWFGVSCSAEIDVFDYGKKLVPYGLECSPCWKKKCPYNLECIQMIDLDAIIGQVSMYRAGWKARRVDTQQIGAHA